MRRVPICHTHKTELKPTSTSHMITSLSFLDEYTAIWASLPLFKLILEILVAGTLVHGHHTFFAIFHTTFLAFWRYFQHVDESALALLFLAEFYVGVIEGLFPEFVLFVFLLDLLREQCIKLRILRKLSFTILLRTQHSLMYFNLINRILRETLDTEIMPTLTQTPRIFHLHIIIAHLTYKNSQRRTQHFLNSNLSRLTNPLTIRHQLPSHIFRQFYLRICWGLGLHGLFLRHGGFVLEDLAACAFEGLFWYWMVRGEAHLLFYYWQQGGYGLYNQYMSDFGQCGIMFMGLLWVGDDGGFREEGH